MEVWGIQDERIVQTDKKKWLHFPPSYWQPNKNRAHISVIFIKDGWISRLNVRPGKFSKVLLDTAINEN